MTISSFMPSPLMPLSTGTLVLRFSPAVELSDDQFFDFCAVNRDLRIERNAGGEAIIRSPTGLMSGEWEAEVIRQLANWAKHFGGKVFSSSAGFRLSNGAIRSPDASWVSEERWATLTTEQRRKFAPVCPDFVVEIRSPSDSLADLQLKMQEFLANGTKLGVLIDPEAKQVGIYRPERDFVVFSQCESVDCSPELPGFALVMSDLF